MKPRGLLLFAAVLCLFGFCSGANATQVGDTREAVLAEKGEPVSALESSTKVILQFPDGSVITLVDGKVTAVERREPPPATQPSTTTPHQSRVSPDKRIIILSIGSACLTAAISFRLFFTDFQGFLECARFYFQPDIISVFRGEWWEDKWGSAKLAIWLFLSVGVGGLVFLHLQ